MHIDIKKKKDDENIKVKKRKNLKKGENQNG